MLSPEVFRLARNNAGWCRLLDLTDMTDTLIVGADGVYHRALFNHRLVAVQRLHPRAQPTTSAGPR